MAFIRGEASRRRLPTPNDRVHHERSRPTSPGTVLDERARRTRTSHHPWEAALSSPSAPCTCARATRRWLGGNAYSGVAGEVSEGSTVGYAATGDERQSSRRDCPLSVAVWTSSDR